MPETPEKPTVETPETKPLRFRFRVYPHAVWSRDAPNVTRITPEHIRDAQED